MENASKALIIAGAILLSILIISLGIIVFQNAKNTTSQTGLNEQEIAVFNGKFDNYIGKNKTAAEIRSMVQSVMASNASEENLGTNRKVKVQSGNGTAKEPEALPTDLTNSKTYEVTPAYTNGLISTLTYK